MEKKQVIPVVVGRINDGAARDFIITACIQQKKISLVTDLKKHSFLSCYASLSAWSSRFMGTQGDSRYCKDLMKPDQLNPDEI